jgi:YD repeat-containing protein
MSNHKRKTKLTDPSAGVYTYTYNQFGEPLTEVTPKGTTTYTYLADGTLNTKDIDGDHTDMGYVY